MKKLLLSAIVLASSLVTVNASADTYSVSNNISYSIGDQIGSQYDQLQLVGNTGTFGNSSTIIGDLNFIVGGNEYAGQDTPVLGTLNLDMTVNGQKLTDTLNYSWTSPGSGAVDIISIKTPDQLHFNSGTVSFGSLSQLSGGGGVVSEHFTASISPVPEAEEWAMMMLGLGLIGAVARHKKEREFKIVAA